MLVGISFSVIIEVEAESYTDNETISKNMDIKKDKAIEDKMFWCDEYDDDDGDNNDNDDDEDNDDHHYNHIST